MSLEPAIDETITISLVTSAADGGAVDADALPTCSVFQDAVDTPIFTPTVVKRASSTGFYRVTIPCTSANGFTVGKTHEVVGKATVGGKAASAVLDRFLLRGAATGSLTPGERTSIAVEVKTNVGNDATAGSLGQQSK